MKFLKIGGSAQVIFFAGDFHFATLDIICLSIVVELGVGGGWFDDQQQVEVGLMQQLDSPTGLMQQVLV